MSLYLRRYLGLRVQIPLSGHLASDSVVFQALRSRLWQLDPISAQHFLHPGSADLYNAPPKYLCPALDLCSPQL